MPIAWLQHRSAFALFLFFPWFPGLPLLPAEPPVIAVETAVPQPEEAALAPEKPLVLPGVVIEELPKGSVLEKAGLQVGDVILNWERLPSPPANLEGARGTINSPFDWMWLEIEQAPRGVMRLIGERAGTPLFLEIAPGQWGAVAVPKFSPPLAAWFSQGRARGTGNDAGSVIKELKSLALWLGEQNAREEEAWLTLRIGMDLASAGNQEEAKYYYLRAVEKAPCDLALSLTLDLAARFFFERGERAEAEKLFRAALDLKTSKRLGELGIAKGMSNLATVLYHQGQKSEADPYLLAAYETYSRLAPQAPGLITILKNIGIRSQERGDLDQSIRYLQMSVALAEVVWPDSTSHAESLHELGRVESDTGRMGDARVHLIQALELFERLDPSAPRLANILNTLSLYYKAQGDLDQALVMARRSVHLAENLKGAEGYIAAGLNTIALIENTLGQWPEAEADLARALDLAPKSEKAKRLVPLLLANMAMVQENQGHPLEALQLYLKALGLKKQNGQVSEIALTLRSLGILHYRLGKPEQARAYLAEALSLQRKEELSRVETADTLNILASVLAESGNTVTARVYYEEALRIIEAVAPTSSIAASVYSNYGVLEQRLGALATAKGFLLKAVEISDALFLRASNSHVELTSFSARNHFAYLNATDVFVALGELNSALEVSERARGRSLAIQLAERDVLPLSAIPDQLREELVKVEESLERVATKNFLAADDSGTAGEAGWKSEQRALFHEREQLLAEFRRSSPRLVNLRYPLALSAKEIRNALDPGTVMITFLVGAASSYLFTVSYGDELRVQTLPMGESALHLRVQRFRALIAAARPDMSLGQPRAVELERLSKELFNLLIAPAADRIEKADRVLIVADGPLHYLPFGALTREVTGADGNSPDEFFAEWKPLHSVLSVSVYAELKKSRRASQQNDAFLLNAFGDPQFSPDLESKVPEQVADVRVGSALRRGILRFEPLPFARREVESIAALFPPNQVAVFLGAEATEERVKAVGKEVRILHFATHASLDEHFSLNSALVLTMPMGFPEDRDNGLLQVWEIFERVRLDADLVVLSACDTGLGEEQGGEGLIGLTRAFQYAGARTVMASLWSVQDRATSELMIRFYKHLRAGLTKDEALRQAQIELIRGPIEIVNEKGEKILLDASAPYFWAGFQLYGDWQ